MFRSFQDSCTRGHEDGGGPCMTILHLILISGVYITPVCIRILVGRPMHYAQGNVEEYCTGRHVTLGRMTWSSGRLQCTHIIWAERVR